MGAVKVTEFWVSGMELFTRDISTKTNLVDEEGSGNTTNGLQSLFLTMERETNVSI